MNPEDVDPQHRPLTEAERRQIAFLELWLAAKEQARARATARQQRAPRHYGRHVLPPAQYEVRP